MWWSSVHPPCVLQRHGDWNQKSYIWTPEQRTNFHQSNVHCSNCLAQASIFFLLVSFSSGFFAAIQPWRPDTRSLLWTVDVEICYLHSEAFTWAAISEAGNSNEPILCSGGNSGSSIPVAVLMRASFIIALDGFCDSYLKKLLKFLTFSVLTDLHVLKEWWTVVSLCLFELFSP